MSKSNYWAHAVINAMRGTNITAPANMYLAAYTAYPGDADSGTEVTGGSYARVAVVWTSPSSKATSNNALVQFPTATANWGEVLGIGVRDASSAGNLFYHWWLSNASYVFTGIASTDVLTIPGYTPVDTTRVVLKTVRGSTLPTGLSADTIYFIRDSSGATCKLATTSGGTAIDLTADGAGRILILSPQTINTNNRLEINANAFNLYED